MVQSPIPHKPGMLALATRKLEEKYQKFKITVGEEGAPNSIEGKAGRSVSSRPAWWST